MTDYTVTTKDGRTVTEGDPITDFRGNAWTFDRITRGPEPSRSALVYAHDASGGYGEYYAEVFDLVVTEGPAPAPDEDRYAVILVHLATGGAQCWQVYEGPDAADEAEVTAQRHNQRYRGRRAIVVGLRP